MLLLYVMCYVCVLSGGRGRTGAGRRGKTVTNFTISVCVCVYYKEEGAGREPVGGEDGGV